MEYCPTSYNYNSSNQSLFTVKFTGNELNETFLMGIEKDLNALGVDVFLIKNDEMLPFNQDYEINSIIYFGLQVVFNGLQENFSLTLMNKTSNVELTKYKFVYDEGNEQ